MKNPLISICIPTYNRANFLKECLESITKQFSNREIKENVNVFVLDNQSSDNTEEVAKNFTNIFENVKYIRDDQNRKIAPGIIKAASLADGEYIWIFSDDDLQMDNTLELVIKNIKKDQPDVIIGNLNSFFGKLEKITHNILKINQDYFFTNRADFFKYLDKKIFANLDFYTTFCSNWVLKREVFENYHYILDKFNGVLDVFPFHSIIFYSDVKIKVKIISSPILFIRGDNESWGSKNKIKHYFYRSRLWKYHYKNIIRFNKNNLSFLSPLKINIKNALEIKSLLNYFLIMLLRKIYLYKSIKFFYHKLK